MSWRRLKSYITSKLYIVFTPLNKIRLSVNGARYGKNLRVRGFIRIQNPKGSVTIGNNVRFNSAEWANPIGYSGKVNIQVIDGGRLIIGDHSGISCASFTTARKIEIGENVLIGAGVKIYDTDFHPLSASKRFSGRQNAEDVKAAEIIIGDGTFIASGSIVLKGVHIGKNCVVGAGSVVTHDIPDNQIWAGNPARYIRDNR